MRMRKASLYADFATTTPACRVIFAQRLLPNADRRTRVPGFDSLKSTIRAVRWRTPIERGSAESAEISLREKRRLSDGVNVRKRSRGLEQLRSPMKGQRVLGAFLGGDDRSFRYFLARLLCAVVVCAGQAKKNQAAYKRGGTTNQQCQAQWINFLAFSPISTGRQPGS